MRVEFEAWSDLIVLSAVARNALQSCFCSRRRRMPSTKKIAPSVWSQMWIRPLGHARDRAMTLVTRVGLTPIRYPSFRKPSMVYAGFPVRSRYSAREPQDRCLPCASFLTCMLHASRRAKPTSLYGFALPGSQQVPV